LWRWEPLFDIGDDALDSSPTANRAAASSNPEANQEIIVFEVYSRVVSQTKQKLGAHRVAQDRPKYLYSKWHGDPAWLRLPLSEVYLQSVRRSDQDDDCIYPSV
jgi:hypothetical protein